MGKKSNIKKLTNLLTNALTHKIGSIVNKEAPYVEKYEKEAYESVNKARRISQRGNWNSYDKAIIRKELTRKLTKELFRRFFLNERKFDLVDEEIEKVLKDLGLN